MNNFYDKKLEGLKEGPKAEIHIDLLKTTLKYIKRENAWLWWNTWFLIQEIHHHSGQTTIRNEQIPSKSIRTRIDDQRKDHIDPKGPKQKNHPKQLQTHNLPTDDVEKKLTAQISLRLFPKEQKRIPQWIQCHRELLCIDQHILN